MDAPVRYRFGSFEIIPADRRLLRNGEPIALTPKAFDTLIVLVTAGDRVVTKEELMQRVWPDTHVDENSINKNISILRKLLGRDLIETVPKLGYRFVAPAEERPSRLWLAVASLSAIAIVTATAARLHKHGEPVRSVTVAPFRDLTASRTIATGVTESLVNRLSIIDGLLVRAPGDADNESDYIVRGAVQEAGNTLRITAEVFDPRRQANIWSRKLDVEPRDVLFAEDTLALEVAAELEPGLTKEQLAGLTKPKSRDASAIAHYLRGRDLLQRRTDVAQARVELERAVEHDPQFAAAWAALAEARALPGDADVQGARDAVARALRLNPSLGDAHGTLGFIRFFYDWNWSGAERSLRTALRLNPTSARVHDWLGVVLAIRGDFRRAQRELAIARSIDRQSRDIAGDVVLVHLLAREYAAAEREARAILARDPGANQIRFYLTAALRQQKKFDEELPIQTALLTRDKFEEVGHALDRYVAGRETRQHVLAMLADAMATESGDPIAIAATYADLGDREHAIQWLTRGFEKHSFGIAFIGENASFDSLRNDARFRDLLRRTNIPEVAIPNVASLAIQRRDVQ